MKFPVTLPIATGALSLALALVPSITSAQVIDYAQADTSSSASTLVLVSAFGAGEGADRPASLLSATYARWSTGEAAGVGYVWRRNLLDGKTHQWTVGAGIGANSFHSRVTGDEHRDSSLSGRAQSEWSGPAPGGTYYALAQASSFRGSWLAVAQYSPSAFPVAPEWARYHERNYQATTVGVGIATGIPRWFLRLGSTRANGVSHPYIGVAYNGF
ncbi:MAG: hypothetical protein ABIV63_17250 [Caldimonas sp.]